MAQFAGRASTDLHSHVFFKDRVAEEEAYVMRVSMNGLVVCAHTHYMCVCTYIYVCVCLFVSVCLCVSVCIYRCVRTAWLLSFRASGSSAPSFSTRPRQNKNLKSIAFSDFQ